MAEYVAVLNAFARPLPFPVAHVAEAKDEEPPPREELRLRHRVLDLRRSQVRPPSPPPHSRAGKPAGGPRRTNEASSAVPAD